MRLVIFSCITSLATLTGCAADDSAPTRGDDKSKRVDARMDAKGHALPEGARFRLGVLRLKYDGYLHAFDVSKDGRFVVSVDADEDLWDKRVTTRVSRADTGEEIVQWVNDTNIQSQEVEVAAAFSLDGKMLARPSGLWSMATGKLLCAFGEINKRGYNQDIAFSSDGKTLAVLVGRSIAVWDVPNRKQLSEITLDADIQSVAISPNGEAVASIVHGEHRTTWPRVWDASSGKLIRELNMRRQQPTSGDTARVTKLVFSPDGKMLVGVDCTRFVGSDYRIHRWNVVPERESAVNRCLPDISFLFLASLPRRYVLSPPKPSGFVFCTVCGSWSVGVLWATVLRAPSADCSRSS